MGKQPVLVVNKMDDPEDEYFFEDFKRLGFTAQVGLSAEHGYGVEKLTTLFKELLPSQFFLLEHPIICVPRLPLLAVPMLGNHLLCNRLLNMKRLIVSDVPGTTRETVELDLDYQREGSHEPWKFRLFDTAGLKRRKRVDTSLDYFSAVRTKHAIEEVDVVFLVLDAREGVTKQDKLLAGHVLDEGKALAILVNKWDLALDGFRKDPLPGYEDENAFRKAYLQSVRKEFVFLPDSPVSFVSAQSGYAMQDFLQVAKDLDARMEKNISTSALNKLIGDMFEHRPPAKVKGKRFKIFYAVQVEKRPFRIKLFCNREHKLDEPYRRYLEKGIQKKFGLAGCPLKFSLAGKEARYQEDRKSA